MMQMLKTVVFLGTLAAASVVTAVRRRRPSRRSPASVPGAAEHRGQAGKRAMKRRALQIGAFLAALAVGGFFVVASGIVPIKASSGHWAITAWFLHFSMRRSVATHTLGLQAPSLHTPSRILKGAGHYETGCRPCHGSPELPHPLIPQQMTPHPPYLPPRIATWEPEELFYIVKHGVKFTGMPAWPAQQRDDEVWAIVAFLLELPDLDSEAYRRLVHGNAMPGRTVTPLHGLLETEQVPQAVTDNCGRCHGVDGHGRDTGAFPKLAGQRPTYLYAALQAYARGQRHSGIMAPIATGLSADNMRLLALYYASRKASSRQSPPRTTSGAIERGKAIASRGIPIQRVPSCVHCHGPAPTRRNPFYPVLAGQYADYLVLQLELFKKEQRGGSAYAHLMHPAAARLTLEQMRDVALYYESLTAEPEP